MWVLYVRTNQPYLAFLLARQIKGKTKKHTYLKCGTSYIKLKKKDQTPYLVMSFGNRHSASHLAEFGTSSSLPGVYVRLTWSPDELQLVCHNVIRLRFRFEDLRQEL